MELRLKLTTVFCYKKSNIHVLTAVLHTFHKGEASTKGLLAADRLEVTEGNLNTSFCHERETASPHKQHFHRKQQAVRK